MKSIKEKAKAYDEAIKRAQAKMEEAKVFDYDDEQTAHTIRLTTTDIFPELKESDDERIRKALKQYFINSFQNNGVAAICGVHIKDVLAWLEKQGEQKVSVDDFKAKDWYVSKVDGKIHNIYHSVTKVKPKFKVGDWVVSPNGVYWHIDSVGERYIVSSTDGISADWPLDTKLYHPFTIQDAKDGDVLVSNDDSYIVLFKGLSSLEDNIDRFKSYCHYYRNILSPIEDPSWCCNAFHPATKEQRDLLFQKMKEAGYEWDAEKKELKKIEQKSSWSEEDEKMFEHIIAKATLHFSSINYLDEEEINFLKSLKDRVQTQQKQEWSEEDERLRTSCIKHIEEELEMIRNDKYGHSEIISDLKESCRERINWLKSLKPQKQWKPSDEQMLAINTAINVLGKGTLNGKHLIELQEQLKKLK